MAGEARDRTQSRGRRLRSLQIPNADGKSIAERGQSPRRRCPYHGADALRLARSFGDGLAASGGHDRATVHCADGEIGAVVTESGRGRFDVGERRAYVELVVAEP